MDKEEGILLIPSLAWGGTGAAGETGEDWGASPSEINLPVPNHKNLVLPIYVVLICT